MHAWAKTAIAPNANRPRINALWNSRASSSEKSFMLILSLRCHWKSSFVIAVKYCPNTLLLNVWAYKNIYRIFVYILWIIGAKHGRTVKATDPSSRFLAQAVRMPQPCIHNSLMRYHSLRNCRLTRHRVFQNEQSQKLVHSGSEKLLKKCPLRPEQWLFQRYTYRW